MSDERTLSELSRCVDVAATFVERYEPDSRLFARDLRLAAEALREADADSDLMGQLASMAHANALFSGGFGDHDPKVGIHLAMERLNELWDIEDKLDALTAAVREAVAELDAAHVPEWTTPEAKAAGKDPWVCQTCGVADGHWPCAVREVADDLRKMVDDE